VNDLSAYSDAVISFPPSPSPSSESGSLPMVLLSAGVISLAAVLVSFVGSSFDGAVASDDKDEEGRCHYIISALADPSIVPAIAYRNLNETW
jgi:hypothetical protein